MGGNSIRKKNEFIKSLEKDKTWEAYAVDTEDKFEKLLARIKADTLHKFVGESSIPKSG